jgi:hypothetical protein
MGSLLVELSEVVVELLDVSNMIVDSLTDCSYLLVTLLSGTVEGKYV